MDPHPSKLEKNLGTLLAEMGALKQVKSEMQRKMGRKMKSWLQNVEAQEHELDEIQGELEQLKTPGFHRDKFNIRLNLNKRVIECLSVVEALKTPENMEVSREDGNEVETPENMEVSREDGNDMEMWIGETEMQRPRRYSYGQLKSILTSDVIIGEGGFGKVYRGKIGKVEVAVKVLKENKDKVMEKQFKNEMRTMFSTSHQHLVKFYGFCFEQEKKALIYEYMENGSLDTILYKRKVGIPWETLYNIAIGTARGISHLHEGEKNPIIHCDIKAANVLLDSNYSPKVTDFGLSKIYEKDSSDAKQTIIGGTAVYAAPEVCMGIKTITLECDIYSFGLMLLEILRRKRIKKNEHPWYPLKIWESFKNGTLEKMIMNRGIEKKNTEEAERLAIAGLWCIQLRPDERPTIGEVLNFLKGVMQLRSQLSSPDTQLLFRTPSIRSYDYNERSDSDDDDDDDDEDDDDEKPIPKRYSYDDEKPIPKRSDDEDADESLRKPKYASTSNLNNPVKPKRNAVVDFAKTLGELFKKTKPQPIYDGDTIRKATNEFSDANKLGEGEFGAVYKGKLLDGTDIAVKKLSKNLAQGSQEFKNEVVLIQKLQHPNLIRLLGFDLSGEEKLLIYEYVPNTSLDKYIFDTTKNSSLDWERRYKIVRGIAQGLLYLHDETRLQIHRDLKAGNILLDKEMNPKIADFGMAKLFETDQTQGDTRRTPKTFGYMAHEYASGGLFSVKSDVYSFGVLLLEIVSGLNASDMHISTHSKGLLSYAWILWKVGNPLQFMDPILRGSFSEIQVIRCIHIGLLCVQDNINDRPTMSSVVLFLNNYSLQLQPPTRPSFLSDFITGGIQEDRVVEYNKSTSSSLLHIPDIWRRF